MNRTEKLAILASLVAAAALTAGCVPSLNYGSVPPEPKWTTKVTTTTATSATKKPFTTPKPRTGTISWEELNGPMEYATRAKRAETAAYTTGGNAVEYIAVGGIVQRVDGYSDSAENNGMTYTEAPAGDAQNGGTEAAPQDYTPQDDTPQTAPPQEYTPQTAPPQEYTPQTAPPAQDYTPVEVPDVSPQPGPPEPAYEDDGE